ncbi:MAG TPA: AAA family ATPase, partial [Clostridia bacterium]|nr:AAA family ATPase [Clostridia bacterium]
MDLFQSSDRFKKREPLATRMRPRNLDEIVGQQHIIGPGKLLRRMIEADRLNSLILYGPPGTGKTTLARVIAAVTKSKFLELNALTSGVKEIRAAIELAKNELAYYDRQTICFVDEIHRLNKAQQDVFLEAMETNILILIGATTENPYFEVNSALLSRSTIFKLEPLSSEEIIILLKRALNDKDRGLGTYNVSIEDAALNHLAVMANGDARNALNALELAVLTTRPGEDGIVKITLSDAEECIQRRAVIYDKS